jgi:hypothetical protein
MLSATAMESALTMYGYNILLDEEIPQGFKSIVLQTATYQVIFHV